MDMDIGALSPPDKGANKKAGERGPNKKGMTKLDRNKKMQFIGLLARTGRRVQTAKALGLSYGNICLHMRKDPEFAQGIEEALEMHREQIDTEIDRRGREGVIEDIYYQGTIVGQRTVFSDTLLLAYAKAHHPAYRDRVQVDQIASADLGIQELSDEDRADLRRILEKRLPKVKTIDAVTTARNPNNVNIVTPMSSNNGDLAGGEEDDA